MTEGCGQIRASQRRVDIANWSGVTAVITGLAAAVLSQMAAKYFHTNAIYFYGPGMGASATGLVTLVVASCKTPVPEEVQKYEKESIGPERNKAADKKKSPTPRAKRSGNPGNEVFHPKMTRLEHYAITDLNPHCIPQQKVAAPSSVRTHLEIARDWNFHKCERIAGIIRDHLGKAKDAKEEDAKLFHEEQIQGFTTAHENLQKSMRSGASITAMEQKKETQIEELDRCYYYMEIMGDGNCLYYSLAVGLLHKMVANESQEVVCEQLLAFTIKPEAKKHKDHYKQPAQSQVVELVRNVRDRKSLFQFLTNDRQMNALVFFLKRVHRSCFGGNDNVLNNYDWADEEAAQALAQKLGGGFAYTFESQSYELLGSELEGTPEYAVIFRNNNHYDVLIRRDILEKIGVPGATSHDVAQESFV
ncbi:MAG: hypothetical protein S4CHLAM81_05790 [Chlamydiales bacterium]|nr:hypothetical protein [Chlamydiales bacterium]MCH9635364.1 hypothetical protein [Chlamydiales bacterium]MCH9704335.1 hypothetical protein [Chlamydiota bacterium]